MNQEDRLNAIIDRVGQDEALKKMQIPAELESPSSFLKILKARHYNWESQRFRKLFAMQFSVKIPPIEQINAIFYPKINYDFPSFIFFCLITKRKVIAHLNLNCPFHDEAYKEEWVTPFENILHNFESFESKDRYPEWMKKYRNSSTIYGLFPKERLEDVSNCCFAYLDLYMNKVSQAKPVSDSDRLQKIINFHDQWVDDIRTQDKAQSMIAKMIGAKKARRIFYEVTT
jgi:phycoerythrobilin:ferredoxin oxidoreductase